MKIPDRVALLRELEQAIAEEQKQLAQVQEGTRKFIDANGYIDVDDYNDDKNCYRYSMQIGTEVEELGPTVVNFENLMCQSFEHKAFRNMIRRRFKHHIHEDNWLMITNLEPEEAVDLVVSLIEEYAEYRANQVLDSKTKI